MTNKDIIKALECCTDESYENCNECPYSIDTVSCERMKLLEDSLDLINRQKAEIEEMKEENLILKQFINGEWVDCKEIQEALSIDFATGLKRFDFSRNAEWCPAPLCGQKITTKFRLSDNKAIKEFAEKLKYIITLNNTNDGYLDYSVDYNCLMEDIDELVKEMESEE